MNFPAGVHLSARRMLIKGLKPTNLVSGARFVCAA